MVTTQMVPIMDEVIASLKLGKFRIIKINHSEIKCGYVQQCFQDISLIPKFHYRDKNLSDLDNCYFGCIIAKKPIYLFVDKNRNKIVGYDVKSKETFYIPETEHEAIKKVIFKSKSAVHYLKRNEKIKKVHKIIWYVLALMCVILLLLYFANKFEDARFASIALNIVVVMALQDCIHVYLLRFERKYLDKYIIGLMILEAISLLTGIAMFVVVGTYDTFGRYNNMLSIILTFGTILIKFDKPRNSG